MPQHSTTLVEALICHPNVALILYKCLSLEDRRACRGVCQDFRTAINGSVYALNVTLSQASSVEDELLRLARCGLEAQPEPGQAQKNKKASGEARRDRHDKNTWHAKKSKRNTVMRGVCAAGLEAGAVVASEVVELRVAVKGAKVRCNSAATGRPLALAYGAAGFSGSGSIGSKGVPVKQMRREACKQFPGRVVLVHEFRTSRVSSARTNVVADQAESFRWLYPVRSMAKRSRIRGLMCSTSNVIKRMFYDRDVSAALNIARIAAGPGRPRELSSWLGRPAMPNPGRVGQEWVQVRDRGLLRNWQRRHQRQRHRRGGQVKGGYYVADMGHDKTLQLGLQPPLHKLLLVEAKRDTVAVTMPQHSTTLVEAIRCSNVALTVYKCLSLADRRACRGVCQDFRTAINGSVNALNVTLSQASSVEDELLRLARSSLRPTMLKLHGTREPGSAALASELSSALSMATPELLGVLRSIKRLDLASFEVPLHLSTIDEICLGGCTQLTDLRCPSCFPGLLQLTQLRSLCIFKSIKQPAIVSQLATLPNLTYLELTKLDITQDQLGQSQHFLFPSLCKITLPRVTTSLLAALDCPKLTKLALVSLHVDSVACLLVCTTGILQHCVLAAALDLVPDQDLDLTAMLRALAAWQPSTAARSTGRWALQLSLNAATVGASHLELLPAGLQALALSMHSMHSCCHVMCRGCTLLPGALHPIANRFTQLQELHVECSERTAEELSMLASRAPQGSELLVKLEKPVNPGGVSYDEVLVALQRMSSLAGQWGSRPGPRFVQA
ncbi:hypothetical protein QJQ45_022824 [Haematococcus lacustris]|nr:hypothetical protein QJQ45_022824 [Haematococcus lacustris]